MATPLPTDIADLQPRTRSILLHIDNEEQRLRQRWQRIYKKALELHGEGHIKAAAKRFSECLAIAQQLKLVPSTRTKQPSVFELSFMASHNLAACYNQLWSAADAEAILREHFTRVVKYCSDPMKPKKCRLDALANLDNSLFSLASQMAHIGKLAELQELIRVTEEFAEGIALQLQ